MTTTPTTGRRPTELSGSPLDEQLLAHFEEHVESELDLLQAYLAVRDTGPEHIRYLIDMILEDEGRHHRTFKELANRIRSDIDFRDYGPMVPYLKRVAADREALIEATDRLLAFEHDDARALRQLTKELKPLRNTTLFSLLVELMALDTKKHVAILAFIRRSAQQTW
jgi:hypothetical protein